MTIIALHTYRFRSVWSLAAPADRVFTAVVDLAACPAWWPDVCAATRLDEHPAELVCRSRLPYELVVRMRRVEENRAEGRMAVALTGDLEGWLRAVVGANPDGTELEITEHVVVRERALRMLAPVARPAIRVNHALMMRRGHRGLRAHVANECHASGSHPHPAARPPQVSLAGRTALLRRPPRREDFSVRSLCGDEVRRNAGLDHLALPFNRIPQRFRIQGGCNNDGS